MHLLDFYSSPFQYPHNFNHFKFTHLFQIVSFLMHQTILIYYEKRVLYYDFLPINGNFYHVLRCQIIICFLEFKFYFFE